MNADIKPLSKCPNVAHSPNQSLAYFVLLGTTLFGVIHIQTVVHAVAQSNFSFSAIGLLAFQTLVEVAASAYAFSFLFTAGAYLMARDPAPRATVPVRSPAVGIVYLCCDDFDRDSFRSLTELCYRGKLYLIVHDDSRSENRRTEVDEAVRDLRARSACEILVLRRPSTEGGKAGASNYVLDQVGGLVEYILVCDNDSTVVDPWAIERALVYFEDEKVAAIQCRNVAADHSQSCRINRMLSRSIDAFNVFMSTYSRFGWQPFVGHGAFLQTKAVREVGGFTPGFFSDDLDLTVRLNLKGYRVLYAPEIRFGETHPSSYSSFRLRSYKWAYGCIQTLRAHTWQVLKSRELTLAEKVSFFQLAGFYTSQAVVLLYLVLVCLVDPFLLRGYSVDTSALVVAGIAVILVIYLPLLAFFAKESSRRHWAGALILCGLVYGCTDFSTTRGVWDCLWRRKRTWTPTNVRSQERGDSGLLAEAFFGASMLVVALLANSPYLYAPCLYLFAGKFLCGPTIALLYNDDQVPPAKPFLSRQAAQFASLGVLLVVSAIAFHVQLHGGSAPGVKIEGKQLYVDGHSFIVKGIHYGPWRPGTGPGKGYAYPGAEGIDSDLQLIQQLNVNTILVYDSPPYVLDLAEKHRLKVLYTFDILWPTVGTPDDAAVRASIVKRVAEYRQKPALLGWVLGNEIPAQVLQKKGSEALRGWLLGLYQSVKAVDSQHPVTHSNWPVTKDLDLGFLDFAGFNLYPLWPPEVVAAGYGNYIKDTLQPIAGNKPLLITEFGADTLEAGEAGQARLLRSCWGDLLKAGASGGVAFEFADEWWKNYDNPKRPGEWWDRQSAPDDEKTHDLDPEEYYGVMTAERQPRMATSAVKEMYSTGSRNVAVPAVVVLTLLLLAFLAWVWARARCRTKRPGTEEPILPSNMPLP